VLFPFKTVGLFQAEEFPIDGNAILGSYIANP
jgi:hypothetical protein